MSCGLIEWTQSKINNLIKIQSWNHYFMEQTLSSLKDRKIVLILIKVSFKIQLLDPSKSHQEQTKTIITN
jgi:hypothetical protein